MNHKVSPKSDILQKLDIRHWSSGTFAELSFVLYFSQSFWNAAFGKALSMVGLKNYQELCLVAFIYLPLIIACIKDPRKYIKKDVLLLYAAIAVFFLASYLLYPENKYWFIREEYGAIDHVFLLRNGLYGYLFVRLIDKPEDFWRLLKYAAVLMYLSFFYQIFVAMRRGYWEGVVSQNAEARLSYSIGFGYNVLFYALPFLYDAIHKRKIFDWAMAFIGLHMILQHGGRGATFCVIGFLLITLAVHIYQNRKIRKILLTYVIAFACFLAFHTVCANLTGFAAEKLYTPPVPGSEEIVLNPEEMITGPLLDDSRFTSMLESGNALASNGRKKIWNAAIDMIKENPWGYGAMGSRPVIAKHIIAGYPHNLLLDLWIDFGVIFGTIIILSFAGISLVLLFRKEEPWGPAFLCAFCCSCALFISLTFWSYRAFWATLAIAVNAFCRGRHANNNKTEELSEV